MLQEIDREIEVLQTQTSRQELLQVATTETEILLKEILVVIALL